MRFYMSQHERLVRRTPGQPLSELAVSPTDLGFD
jgi:hypothetical protein